jgi:hypothetical protein
LVPSHDKGCVITPDKLGLILISDYVGNDIESNFSQSVILELEQKAWAIIMLAH